MFRSSEPGTSMSQVSARGWAGRAPERPSAGGGAGGTLARSDWRAWGRAGPHVRPRGVAPPSRSAVASSRRSVGQLRRRRRQVATMLRKLTVDQINDWFTIGKTVTDVELLGSPPAFPAEVARDEAQRRDATPEPTPAPKPAPAQAPVQAPAWPTAPGR